MNSLLDASSIRALYRASQAGVEVKINVRGICALRPGVPGVSENIEVTSVVGRFLEHSRIFSFERHDEAASVYIGSADLMPRNLYNRVELVTPVDRSEARAPSWSTCSTARFADNTNSWELDADGRWTRRTARRRTPQRPARADRAPRRAGGVGRRRRDAVSAGRAPGARSRHTSLMADRHHAHGYWLEEAGPVEPAPPLEGDARADVVIVGGGYTGLWTAWHLKRLEPEARVVLLEAGVCGDGPSGRNGGFCNALWFGLPAMRDRFGDERRTRDRPRRPALGRRDRPLLRRAGRRRLVSPGRLHAGLDRPGVGPRLGRRGRGVPGARRARGVAGR